MRIKFVNIHVKCLEQWIVTVIIRGCCVRLKLSTDLREAGCNGAGPSWEAGRGTSSDCSGEAGAPGNNNNIYSLSTSECQHCAGPAVCIVMAARLHVGPYRGGTKAQRGKPLPKATQLIKLTPSCRSHLYTPPSCYVLLQTLRAHEKFKNCNIKSHNWKWPLLNRIPLNLPGTSVLTWRVNSHLKILWPAKKSQLKLSKMSNLLTLKCNFKGAYMQL